MTLNTFCQEPLQGYVDFLVTILSHFEVSFYKTILIMMCVTLWNRLNVYLSRIIGFGVGNAFEILFV